MRELVIAADDRTGALEVAGECSAIDGEPILVVPFGVDVATDVRRVVVDLSSRHLVPAEAADRAAAVAASPTRRRAHKIDSALRGNWAAEVAARIAVGDGPVVVVAALPAIGRICRDGVVGSTTGDDTLRPIADVLADDGRGAPSRSRPADHLRDSGIDDALELAPPALATWLAAAPAGGVAVCDAQSSDDLREIGRALAGGRGLLAGTAAAIAAWHGDGAPIAATSPDGADRILVVCGSLDDGARRQLAVLLASGLPVVGVVTSPADVDRPVPVDVADAMARRLADETATATGRLDPDVVVVVGGDTTAAVLGDSPMLVIGRVEAGAALSRRVDGSGPWFVTRSGSFGADGALRDLVAALVR